MKRQRRLRVFVFLLVLSVIVGALPYKTAAASEDEGWLGETIEVCGRDGCNKKTFGSSEIPPPAEIQEDDLNLSHLAPPVAPYYKVTTELSGAPKQHHFLIPSSERILWGLIDAKVWTRTTKSNKKYIDVLMRIVSGRPYPSPVPKKVLIEGKAVSDPRPYVGLFGLSSRAVAVDEATDKPKRAIEILWNEDNPWSGDGKTTGEGKRTQMTLIGSSIVQWQDGFTASVSPVLEKVIKRDLAGGGSHSDRGLIVAIAAASVAGLGVLLAAGVLAKRRRPSRR